MMAVVMIYRLNLDVSFRASGKAVESGDPVAGLA